MIYDRQIKHIYKKESKTMKHLKTFFFFSSFVIALSFLTVFFSGISIAEQKQTSDCVSTCAQKKQACYNINPNRTLCEAEFKKCVAACNVKEDLKQAPAQAPSSTNSKPQKPATNLY
jgi:hypothetical protein